jgi:putative transposase
LSYRRVNHYQSVQPDGGQQLPRGKKHTAEQIIGKLREAEIAISKGGTTKEAAKAIGVTDQTFFRWRKEYRGLRPEQAKRLKALEKESSPLKRLLADAELDKAILKEAASGNF